MRLAGAQGKQGGSGLARPLLLGLGVLGAILLLRALPATGGLERLIGGWGPYAPVVFVAVATAACAVGLPRLAVAFAAGYAFGVLGGTGLAMAGQMLGCGAAFFWARAVGRGWFARRRGGRLARIDAFLTGHAFSATLMLRLLPVGSNLLVNLGAGLSGASAGPFLAATALGYLPQTVVFALLGSGARLGRGTELALGGALFAVSALLGAALMLRRDPAIPDDGGRTGLSPPCN